MSWDLFCGGEISIGRIFKVLEFAKTPLGGYNSSWGAGEYVYCRGCPLVFWRLRYETESAASGEWGMDGLYFS